LAQVALVLHPQVLLEQTVLPLYLVPLLQLVEVVEVLTAFHLVTVLLVVQAAVLLVQQEPLELE
jgi:hypothetical protein